MKKKRASVVCHSESEPQKKITLDTEQDSTPHPSVSYGGSSASGARPSITTSADLNTDMTREARTGSTQDVSRVSNSDDVVVREDNADGKRSRTPEFVGSDGRRRITTKRGSRGARDERSSTIEQHVPRRILGETTPREQAVARHARGTGPIP